MTIAAPSRERLRHSRGWILIGCGRNVSGISFVWWCLRLSTTHSSGIRLQGTGGDPIHTHKRSLQSYPRPTEYLAVWLSFSC